MKRMLSTFGLVVLMSMTSLTANAHDIAVTSNGVTFYYNFANNGKELSVTFQGDSFDAYNEYSGSIVIPSTVTYNGTTYQVTSIGEKAFRQCDGLTSVTIPNSVMTIGEDAFDNCYVLTNVTIPNSVTTIGKNAFNGCFALANITIPNSVTTIGDFAFEHCHALTSITIPSSVTTIGNGLFALCDALTSISVSSGNTVFDSRDNCNAIIEKATNTLVCGCDKTVIPNTVTAIGNYAFYYCNRLTSMNIPNSVTAIGNHAFDNCGSLTSVTIPNSVTTIGESAFYHCNRLTSMNIPNSVTYIGQSAFEACRSLTSVTIPNSMWIIDASVFQYCHALTTVVIPKSISHIEFCAFNGCDALTSVTVYNEKPPSLSPSAFSNFDATLYVPYGSKAAYEGANYWKDFASIVEMNPAQAITFADANVKALCVDNWDLDGDGELSTSEAAVVTDLGQVFKNNSQITTFQELQYFTGLTAIGNLAFYQCTSLTSVIIPSSVKDIGKQAFNNCDALTSINIPSSVTSIGQNAFSGCHGLTSITIPSPVTFIDQNTFYNCI